MDRLFFYGGFSKRIATDQTRLRLPAPGCSGSACAALEQIADFFVDSSTATGETAFRLLDAGVESFRLIIVMAQEHSQRGAWLVRNWFLVLVVSFAVLLGAIQFWVERAFHPPLLITGVVSVVSIAALFGLVLGVLRLRRPFADLRYRWLTRDVSRAMKQTKHNAKRPVRQPANAARPAGG